MEFKWIQGRAEGFADASVVRTAVFCAEQGYSPEGEIDEIDDVAWHLVGYQNGQPVCTARLFGTPAAGLHVGRVAVLKECRGLGLGRAVMEQQEEKAAALGAVLLVLNAQVPRSAFYRHLGYKATGTTSLDEGEPHMEMSKELAPRTV